MAKLAVFASGNGSNLQALIDAIEHNELDATIELVVCDRPGAYCIKRAKKVNIPTFVFKPGHYKKKENYEKVIKAELVSLGVDYLVLAGYMRLVGSTLLDRYPKRIINIHPSLLPCFPGKDGIGQALKSGVDVTGVTIHYVDEGMDTGPIIAQREVLIECGETRASLEEKIHAVEHVFYPQVLQEILTKKEFSNA